MKKLLLTLLLGLVLIPSVVFAETSNKPNIGLGTDSYLGHAIDQAGYDKNTSATTFASTLGTVVKILMSFTGIIFMTLMVYAGFLWMTARGEESQIEKSQKLIKAAIIGLVIVVSAYSITFFIVPTILSQIAPSGAKLE
ncbi:MAG: hypothetical protein Q8P20_05320 [bacterium]|nr:hypothetical protein [bacterium]